MTILAVGASGKFACLVIFALAGRGAKVRGLVRKPDQADQVRSRCAAEIAVGDLGDRANLDAALQGVDAVFCIAPAFLPSEAEVRKSVMDAARRAGMRRYVFSSVIYPVLSGFVNRAAKAPVDEVVLNSDLEFTVYFQNYAAPWPKIVEAGVLAEPWSVDTRFTRVHYRDVAEVRAIALIEDSLSTARPSSPRPEVTARQNGEP